MCPTTTQPPRRSIAEEYHRKQDVGVKNGDYHSYSCEIPDRSELKGLPTHPELQKRSYHLTVATLAREAHVGRNPIYTNDRSTFDELRRASDRKIIPEKLSAWEDKLAQQRF
ncbi:hypothetical protein Q1M64_02580 (plasmid) [Sinorhizobium meliloti]|nr:hypothetical protein LZK74_05640 [Sinorhizobium meliloti]WKL23914.1 hypothetical protein Q1M63_06185 [Sinorhizobium meliloti]WKL27675.1 hypothetical protein Q1M65_04635 [Sinorhizobium meliloti]WKL33226.1 hypothetical protein Q1M62_04270 [Sinorhizobium meliloti]WKL39514.1 hypothetical protein Q1M64_02580 [Sinorhizobium meliloti]